MFIGHFGVGFAAKKLTSKPSLGTLFIAAQFIDLLWPLLLMLGVERVAIQPGITAVTPLDFQYYPYSHSLFATLFWGVMVGGAYFLLRKDRRGAIWLGVLVLSHWLLDFLTHRPDLPLAPGAAKVGLGLWNSLPATLIVEGLIFAVGVYLYQRSTRPKNKTGSIALWSLVGFLVIVYLGNIFGPPPESVEMLPIVGMSQWLLVAWGYWVDRNREPALKSR